MIVHNFKLIIIYIWIKVELLAKCLKEFIEIEQNEAEEKVE